MRGSPRCKYGNLPASVLVQGTKQTLHFITGIYGRRILGVLLEQCDNIRLLCATSIIHRCVIEAVFQVNLGAELKEVIAQ